MSGYDWTRHASAHAWEMRRGDLVGRVQRQPSGGYVWSVVRPRWPRKARPWSLGKRPRILHMGAAEGAADEALVRACKEHVEALLRGESPESGRTVPLAEGLARLTGDES